MADNFDKFRPDWTVGTLTLTGGSTAFTATNAELILAAIREGDAIITPSGFFLPIETLAEDGLTGTLSNPAPAAAAGTFDTRIRYQSDNSRFTGALLALTRQLTGGNLQSFGNLQGLQDLMPIFLGPGSVGLINKSEVGIQDPSGSLGKLAALTLGNRQILQTDENGELKALSLASNKFLRTDANGDLAVSDIAAWAISMLGLTGIANKFPYLNAANTAELADITPLARSVLDDTTGAAMWNTMGGGGSLVPNGWSRSPNGLIMNWGNINIANGDQGILFPQAFPNQVFGVVIGAAQSTPNSATTFYGASADSYTLSSFAAHGRYIGNGGSVGQAAINASYIALGR